MWHTETSKIIINSHILVHKPTKEDTMDINIKAIHFDISEKLTEFINKKVEKLTRRHPAVATVDISLKVVKPETALNKQAIVRVAVPQQEDIVADKTADSFEEAIDVALEAIDRQLEKIKNKK